MKTDVDTTAANVATDQDTSVSGEPLDLALADLRESADQFLTQVIMLQRLRDDGFFKHVSKPRRNELLQGLLETADTNRETARAVYSSMKKIKRERISEELVDKLLEGQSMTNDTLLVGVR